MKWSEFKKAVDKWIEENSEEKDPTIRHIDISYPDELKYARFEIDKFGHFFLSN